MGIKDLWTILTPFCERKPLYELQGKTVAVDLSCWICEAQNISDYSVQPRMYLRNLYFRTCYLLLMEVIPVFVLEGKAPVLKHQTIADRNAVQFKGARPKTSKTKTDKGRTRFNFVLKQCEEMLKYMGLACIQGEGEAEAMCAYLNSDGMVSGCISQDSDCFAYGAIVVYRNFSISHQGQYAASGGAVDIYDIRKAIERLKFGRNKIIALALICGSDYNDGVFGVGKDSALKFFEKYDDEDILDRLRSWRKNESLFKELDKKVNDKNMCSSCGHFGKLQSHTKCGCIECKTNKGCDFTKFREERLEIKNELQIRNKALVDPQFPNESLIKEFLVQKDNVIELDLKWKQPNLINFVKFTYKYLGWEEIYAFEKMLPILTRWQILNYEFVSDKMTRNSISGIKGILFPYFIKKARNPKGIPSYEIIWEDRQKYFEHLIPEEQFEEYQSNKKNGLESLWSTIEPKNLVDKAYPSLVEEFLEKKNKKSKKATKRRKNTQSNNLDNLSEQLSNTSISEPKPKRGRKKKNTKPSESEKEHLNNLNKVNINTIENYFIQDSDENNKKQLYIEKLSCDLNDKNDYALEDDKIISGNLAANKVFTDSHFMHLKNESLAFDLDASTFGDEDNLDISCIVNDIVSRNVKLPKKIANLGYQVVLSDKLKDDYFLKNVDNIDKNLNESCFFGTNYEEVDLFEKTFHEQLSSSSNSDDTLEYNIDEDVLKANEEKIIDNVFDEKDDMEKQNGKLNDTFDFHYVPLLERIKKNTV